MIPSYNFFSKLTLEDCCHQENPLNNGKLYFKQFWSRKDQLENQIFEQYLAFVYFENADQAKYESIPSGLNTEQSLGR